MPHKELAPTNFEIPQLVPDDEPVEAIDRFATTSPGAAGFSYKRPKEGASTTEQPARPRLSGYASSQRRQMLEEFQLLAQKAEDERYSGERQEAYKEDISKSRTLGRQALEPQFHHR